MQSPVDRPESRPLRLLLLGATGGTGRELLKQALSRGHLVTAVVRSPEKLLATESLTIRKGDVRDTEQLRNELPAQDAVLSALGHRGLGPSHLLRNSADALASAMRKTGVHRLLVVSVAMLFRDMGIMPALLRNTVLRNVAQDSMEMEGIVASSGLDWTIARPPLLTNGPLTGRYLAADGTMPQGNYALSRADLAAFMLDEVERPRHEHRIVGLASLKTMSRTQAVSARPSTG